MRKCKYCKSTHELMEITQLHGIKLSFEHGIEVKRVGKVQVVCNRCFIERIWGKKQ